MIAQEGGGAAGVADHRFGDLVEGEGGHPRRGGLAHGLQRGGDQRTGDGHRVEFTGTARLDHLAGAQPRQGDHGLLAECA